MAPGLNEEGESRTAMHGTNPSPCPDSSGQRLSDDGAKPDQMPDEGADHPAIAWLRRISRNLIILVLVGMIAVATFGFFALRTDLRALQDLSLERIEWKAARIETEAVRFADIIGRYALGDPAIDASSLAVGFTQFEQRVAMYVNGTVGTRIRDYDSEATLDGLQTLFADTRSSLTGSSEIDRELATNLAMRFAARAEGLGELALAVVWGEELRFHTIRADLRESTAITLTLSIVAMVLSLALAAALAVEAKRYRKDSEESRALARAARAASEAKSRFLSMMSHELRTPMNGVLGLVSLVRQSGVTDRQQRMLERAEAAGRQMIDQLVDILDFAELETRVSPVERAPFDPAALAGALRDLFDPVAEREGLQFSVVVAGSEPKRVVGDVSRSRQIVSHLTSFLIQRVAIRDLRVSLGVREHALQVLIELSEPAEGRPGWRADAILGTGTVPAEIKGDALGPAIARGLLSQLGGSLALHHPEPGRAQVEISIPVDVMSASGSLVMVDAVTQTQQMILPAMLSRIGARLFDPLKNGSASPDVILFEPGGNEEQRLAHLRSRFPVAHVVATGPVVVSSVVDTILSQPVGGESLRAAIERTPRSDRRWTNPASPIASSVAFARE